MTKPLVSLGVPVYNGGAFLESSLRSLMAQTYEDLEILVEDNASTDETPSIVAKLAEQDPRISYRRVETNEGAVANFDRVFMRASGELFAWCGDHDLRRETFVERCVDALAAHPQAVLAFTRGVEIDEDGALGADFRESIDTTGVPRLHRPSLVVRDGGGFTAVYGLFRKEVLERTGLFRLTYGPDPCLLAEVSLLGDLVEVPEELLIYRVFKQGPKRKAPGEGLRDYLRYHLSTLAPGYEVGWLQSHLPTVVLARSMLKATLPHVKPSDRPLFALRLVGSILSRWKFQLIEELGLHPALMRFVALKKKLFA